ncbi:hypothetical protein I656_04043 [Geobacillus sp. WSUCF1]|nr:hypothetical protein I656_04043 [Geobacillus sp. WSUCF1]
MFNGLPKADGEHRSLFLSVGNESESAEQLA